jgi:hypothetical protein
MCPGVLFRPGEDVLSGAGKVSERAAVTADKDHLRHVLTTL